MKELDDEIKLTLNLMQTDIDDGAHGELQSHLYDLLEMRRNELQQRLVERSWSEPVTLGHHPAEHQPLSHDWDDQDKCRRCGDRDWYATATCSPKQQPEPDVSALAEPATPLTAEELKDGGWWLDGAVSQSLLELFREYGVNITGVSSGWFDASVGVTCVISSRDFGSDLSEFKQIHKIGNEFYWYEK